MSNVVLQRLRLEDLQPVGYTDGTPLSSVIATQDHPTFSLDTWPPPPDLTPYIIKTNDRYLAGGAFGDVYKCRYLGGNMAPLEVAVKALRFKSQPDEDTEDKCEKMLRRELGIWKRLSHTNIVPFLGIAYGFGMIGAMSLVSSWMPNETLHKLLATHDDKLDTVHRLQILLDISKGLHYLHSLLVVHGDLNPNNVLLDANYTARLADFGYASLAGNIPEALDYLKRSTARPGALRWIAPEQIGFEGSYDRTIKSDIYSFGCIALQGGPLGVSAKPVLTVFQVLSGKQPWSEVREDASIVLHLHLGHKPSRPRCRTIHDSHWDFIQRCWSPLQERPTADAALRAVQQFLDDFPPSEHLRDLFISPSHLDEDFQQRSPQSPPRLSRSLANLWNKIKQGSSVHTTSVSTDDIAVFVLGPTGSGKSWFVKAATRNDLVEVSGDPDLKPLTSDVRAIRCELAEEAKTDTEWPKNIVFIDPPSFLTGYDHPNAQRAFQAWFDQVVYAPQSSGVIYVHRIETDPALEPIEPHLKAFCNILRIFGEVRLPRRLHVVISYDRTSSVLSESKVTKHRAKIHTQLALVDRSTWKASIHKENFQGEPEVAWRAIEELLQHW